jgi:LPS-assembly lipoprotein
MIRTLRLRLTAALALAATSLGGCGFTPLYASPHLVAGLSTVQVIAPEGRTGYLLREHLDDALAKDRSVPPAWRMELSISEQRFPRGVRVDNVASRYEYVLTANYVLTPLPTGAAAKSGQVRVQLTYDSADQPYASIAAQQDVADRAAEEAADRIQMELAVWLATKKKS